MRLFLALTILGLAAPTVAQPLRYSTYLDASAVLAAAADGSIVTADAPQVPGHGSDIRIMRFSPTTHAGVASIVVGGTADDKPASVAVAADGSIWVGGSTQSSDFPMVNPAQSGPIVGTTSVLLRVSPNGSTLLFSTYLAVGGSTIRDVVAARDGTVTVAGQTFPGIDAQVPTTPAVFQRNAAGGGDVFLAQFSASGGLVAASYFGGAGSDDGRIAVAADGAIYLAGGTTSTDLATTSGAFQTTAGGRSCVLLPTGIVSSCVDGYVARIARDLSRIDYLTYLRERVPAPSDERVDAIAVNAAGDVFVTGSASAADAFPTTSGAYQPTCASCPGVTFVARLNASGSALVYSTFLGAGSASTVAGAIAIDEFDRAYVTGQTTSASLPNVNAFQPALHGVNDAFLARLNAAGNRLEQATYLGGRDDLLQSASVKEMGTGILLTAVGGVTIWICGDTHSSDFPTTSDAFRTGVPPVGFTATGLSFLTAFSLSDAVLTLDVPLAGAVGPEFGVGGWAIDRGGATNAGIDAVHVYAYPNPGSGARPLFLGTAGLNYARPDVASIFGPQFGGAGWNLNVGPLSPGSYLLAVYARSAITGTFVALETRLVTVVSTPQPILTIDVPAPNTVWPSPLFIGGWAIDRGATSGTGIDTVHIWAYPNPGSGAPPIFVGVPTLGVLRPDVGGIYGSRFTASGWELLSPMAPGTYLLAVFGHSTVTDSFNVLQTRTVTIR